MRVSDINQLFFTLGQGFSCLVRTLVTNWRLLLLCALVRSCVPRWCFFFWCTYIDLWDDGSVSVCGVQTSVYVTLPFDNMSSFNFPGVVAEAWKLPSWLGLLPWWNCLGKKPGHMYKESVTLDVTCLWEVYGTTEQMHAIVRHLISEIERQRTTCYVLLLKEKHRRRRSVFNGMEEEERIA